MKRVIVLLSILLMFSGLQAQVKILFNANKAESAGNADWVIDADQHNLGFTNGQAVVGQGTESNPQQIPTPAQSNVTASTSETYWNGGISAWGIDLVKKGYIVETLPYNGVLSYGNSNNPQDLSNYKVFIDCEPNIVYTSAEKTAILQFVQNGGGLFMVSDHDASDRNGDGWDSPAIWNDLMTNNGIQSNPFGIAFDLVSISQTTTNIPNLPNDPILHGVMGDVTSAMWSAGTTMTINPAANSSVIGTIYKMGSSTSGNTNVMFAYANYGSGKVAAIGDSSPCDDGSGDPGDQLYDGWMADANGNHERLIMNATIWLATSSVTPTLSVSPSSQSVSAASGNTSFTITSNSNWSAVSNQSWCTVTTSGSGNGNLSASCTLNTTSASRTANITVTVSGLTAAVVTVNQAAPTLSVTPSNQNASAASGSTSFAVTSNSSWTATSNQSWCTVTSSGTGNGTLTANFSANSTLAQRTANITIAVAGLNPVVVTVTQAAALPTLSVSPSSLSVSYPESSSQFTVSSNTAWTAVSDQSWCIVTPSGTGSGIMTASYTANTLSDSRTASIQISASGVTPVSVTVTQEAVPLATEPSNYPTSFSAHSIHIQWSDAVGSVVPQAYLVRMSSNGFDAISIPVDGTAITDGPGDKNVAAGIQEAWFGNLEPLTTYYFKIFGYTGSGNSIDYKIDGPVPEVEMTTQP